MDYEQFLQAKRRAHIHTGFDASINTPHLFEFQKWVVERSLRAGKYGIFSGTGTGKSRMQLKWCEHVSLHTNERVLLLAPLGVGTQTMNEGKSIGINFDYIDVNNYEQLDNIDPLMYAGIAIDEGSILKNFEGAYRNLIIEKFKNTPYKSVWTATPAPNDPMEIGNYADFLGVMSRNEMLAMYFVHDGGETSKWRLKKHAEKRFWEWVATWAVMFQHPRDINFEQDGYDLPQLHLHERCITTDKRDNGKLFNDTSVSATEYNRELRLTQAERMAIAAELAISNNEQYLIWIKHNEEGKVLRGLIPGSIEVSGTDDNEIKAQRLLDFAAGRIRVLITKEKIASMGWNFQLCGNQIFASVGFSFEQIYQAIRRSLRFGRIGDVNAYLITTDTMQNVIATYYKKEKMFLNMQKEMTKAVNTAMFNQKPDSKTFHDPVITDMYELHNGDSVRLIKNIPSESIGFSISSWPFRDLYVYSDNIEDIGNCASDNEFSFPMQLLCDETFRVMQSGRNVAIHCMDLPIQKGKEGYIGLRDFSGTVITLMQNAGFIYHSRVTIWKNPVTEMQRTKSLGLLHKQVKKDSSMSRVGIPDYLLVFRKPGEHLNPITNTGISVDTWQKYASPVWMDIDYGDTLNGRLGREESDEKHICCLQLPTIERAIHLWSNPGDTVLTQFLGVGSEIYQSVLMGRKGYGIELKQSYFVQAVENCREALLQTKQKTLFS